jgi:hypothetical protein
MHDAVGIWLAPRDQTGRTTKQTRKTPEKDSDDSVYKEYCGLKVWLKC